MVLHDLDDRLREEKTRLEDEQRKLTKQIAKAQGRSSEITDRLFHINGLLGLSHEVEAVVTEESLTSVGNVADIAEEILAERGGEHMYYKELASAVQARGGKLPSENGAGILVARIVSDGRFVRPYRKGYYALRKDYPDAKNVGARKKRGG